VLRERRRHISGQVNFRPTAPECARLVRFDQLEISLEIEAAGEGFIVRFGGSGDIHQLRSDWKPGEPLWQGSCDGRPLWVKTRPLRNGFELFHRGIETSVQVYSPREAEAARLMPGKASANSGNNLRSPMPGLVVSIAVAPGQEVKTGE